MAGRSSQADNRGSDYFGLLVSGGKQFITSRDGRALPPGIEATGGTTTNIEDGGINWTKYIPLLHQVRLLYLILEVYPQILNIL